MEFQGVTSRLGPATAEVSSESSKAGISAACGKHRWVAHAARTRGSCDKSSLKTGCLQPAGLHKCACRNLSARLLGYENSSVFTKDKFQITRFLRFASQITRRFSDHPASATFCLSDHPTRRNVVSRLPNTAKCRFQVTRVAKFLFPDHPVLRFASQITRRFPDHPA